jgi:hypothetical protein
MVGYRSHKDWAGDDYPKTVWPPTSYYFLENPYNKGHFIKRKSRIVPPKRARIVDHPYSVSWDTTTDSVSTILHTSGSSFSCTYANAFGGVIFNDFWTSNDDLKVLDQLRTKIEGSSFNLGVFLAEGHQSLEMIRNCATGLSRAITRTKKGDYAGAVKALRTQPRAKGFKAPKSELSNRWLELQYGWLPLLQDVEAGAEALAKVFNFPMQDTYTAFRKVRGTCVSQYPYSVFDPKVSYADTSMSVKAKVTEVNVPQLLGLTDPLSVIWEKTPYSFVADWFIPIGSYLSARGLAQALTGTFVTSKRRKCVAARPIFITGSPFSWVTDPNYRQTQGYLVRSVSSELRPPLPSMKTLGQAASWRHCANAVALLSQAFK